MLLCALVRQFAAGDSLLQLHLDLYYPLGSTTGTAELWSEDFASADAFFQAIADHPLYGALKDTDPQRHEIFLDTL